MNTGRVRYLLVFFVAMFLANNVAAAARACIVELTGQEHAVVQQADAGGDEHVCPVSEDAARCFTHCTQSFKNDQQKLATDVPGIAFASPLSLPRVWFRTEPRALVVAAAPPPVGPPLTILFGNLRI